MVLIGTLVLAGCGKKGAPTGLESNAGSKVGVKQPKPPKTNPDPEPKVGGKLAVDRADGPAPRPPAGATMAFTNTLGMVFKPVPETEVQFCIWETRVKDYAAYVAANVGVNERWKEPGFKQADTHPVVNVGWNDAQAFCAWLTKNELAAGKIKAGQKYRLPTDAEWSVAVGLGKEEGKTPEEKHLGIEDMFPWGKRWPPPKGAGNYDNRFYSELLKVDEFEYTAPVGSFAANQHGLHDLGGNVLEWCEDKFRPNEPFRVLRGASWLNGHPGNLSSSYRTSRPPAFLLNYLGFRCVLAGE